MQERKEPNLTCPRLNEAKMVCASSKCLENVFICTEGGCADCQNKHQECEIYRVKNMISKLHEKKKPVPQSVKKMVEAMEKVYDEAIQRLSDDKQRLKDQLQMYGYYPAQIQFLRLVNEGCLKEVRGEVVGKVMKTLNEQMDFNVDEVLVAKFWEKHQKNFNQTFDKFKQLPQSGGLGKLESKITDKSELIESYLESPVYRYKLLFRASENRFSVNRFHLICDGIPNTLVLAKTQFGRVIGGFTPLPWNDKSQYMSDQTGKSFLFSITNREKYICTNSDEAIYGKHDYGPTFGSGHDFHIGDRSDVIHNGSYFNLSSSYNTPDMLYQNGEEAYENFSGATGGDYYAKVMEWEVFEIDWL